MSNALKIPKHALLDLVSLDLILSGIFGFVWYICFGGILPLDTEADP